MHVCSVAFVKFDGVYFQANKLFRGQEIDDLRESRYHAVVRRHSTATTGCNAGAISLCICCEFYRAI